MEFKPKNREWVKNAAIVFLAVLLVLTFFSNTIMNRTLPEVATAAVTDGSIVAKVRGSGTVKANGNHDVKATQTREIRSVMVKVGQEVKTGDPLFVLGAGDSAELEAAKESLRDLQYSYQKAAVNMPTFNNTAEYRALETADRNLEAAKKTYADAKTAYETVKTKIDSTIKPGDLQNLEKAKKDMEDAYKNLVEIQASYDNRYLALSEIVTLWQNEVNNKLSSYEPEPAPEPTTAPTPEPTTEPTEPPQNDVPASGTGESTGSDNVQPPENTPANTEENNTPSTENGGTDQQEVTAEAVAFHGTGKGFVQLLGGQSTGSYVALSSAGGLPPIDITQKDKDESVKNQIDALSLTDTQRYLAAAQADLSAFVQSNKSTLSNANTVYETAKAKYDALSKYTDEKYFELIPYRAALDEADAALTTAENAYDDALANLSYTQSNNNKTLTSASIDLQQLAEKIKLAQDKVKELSGDAGDQIVANVNGTVTAIGCSAGDTVTKDTIVCSIEVPDMGHTLSFSVTNDQAQRLRVGDTATVSNYYWGKEIVATLTTIRTDPKNPQTNKELTFDLSGDVTSGSELTISVGQKSANYDVIIPNSAIRSDNNGKFVLAIQAKSSPLGNRYLAKRVSVEVLAADDNNSAVVADLGYGDYVITTSSSPVKSGDQVRMAESNG